MVRKATLTAKPRRESDIWAAWSIIRGRSQTVAELTYAIGARAAEEESSIVNQIVRPKL